MSIFGRASVPVVPVEPATRVHCEACGSTSEPLTVTTVVDFGDVWACADPAGCHRRAELAGTWCA